MRWTPGPRSENLEDRRGGGGFPGIRLGVGGLVLLGALSLLTGRNFFALLGDVVDQQQEQTGPSQPHRGTPEEEHLVDFVSFVLDDAQNAWRTMLPGRWHDAKLVLFTDAVRSGCGVAESAMGPFYCPADEKVYIDLGFYRELRDRYGAPGDFAQAYVIAHELGHHVQHLLGLDARREADDAHAASVRFELQADCLAGVWGQSAERRQLLDAGDVQEGMGAASAVGDDRLQRAGGGRVNPETWTHGSSQQRAAWFRHGYEAGDARACDTFSQRLPADR